MPHLEKIKDKYAAERVEVLAIDVKNLRNMTQKIADKADLSVTVLLDNGNVAGDRYKVFATPTTFIVDGSGRAIFKHVGYDAGEERMFEREIEVLLQRRTS